MKSGRKLCLVAAVVFAILVLLSGSMLFVYITGRGQRTPLHQAVLHDQIDVAQQLLARGARINAREEDGDTPLHFAGSLGMAKLLVSKGARIDAMNDYGATPLYDAVHRGLSEVVAFLLQNGADPNVKDEVGQSVLERALVVRDEKSAISLIQSGADVNAAWAKTPLHIAAQKNLPKAAAALIENGANLTAMDEIRGATPMHFAALSGSEEILSLLIQKTTIQAVNAKTSPGATPLHYAGLGGQAQALEQLINAGAQFDLVLLEAAATGDLPKLRNIIEKTPDAVRQADSYGWTALHWAVAMQQYDAVIALRSANVRALDNEKRSPLSLALRRDNLKMARLLLAQGARMDPSDESILAEIDYAARMGRLATLKFVITQGIPVDVRFSCGGTPLHRASANGQVEAVRYLIDEGADVNAVDNANNTALSAACFTAPKATVVQTVELLLDNGADPYIEDDYGHNTFYFAPDIPEVKAALLKYAADRQGAARPNQQAP